MKFEFSKIKNKTDSIFEYSKDKLQIPSFRFYLFLSLTCHIGLFLIFVFGNAHFNFFNKSKVIQTAVRVDMVGLPELEQKKQEARKQKKKQVAIKQKKKPKPKPKKKPAPDKKKAEAKETNQANSETKIPKKDDLKKGNKVSQGVDEGAPNGEQMQLINIYLTRVIGIIKLNWKLPKYLSDQNYFAQLEVRIDDTGRVIYKNIVQSSGNDIFDGKVLKAIEASAPFPPPPLKVQKLISEGIVFGLSSND